MYSAYKLNKQDDNIQQVKEHDKCPQNQTKEEKIVSLPEKEFRIMIVEMIQSLENKMEFFFLFLFFFLINKLEIEIEKVQETFNKDIEEISINQ